MNMSKNIVITGGSSGFGRAMAHEFYKRNNKVIITGRNTGALNEASRFIEKKNRVKHAACYVFPCDVRDYKQVDELGQYAKHVFEGKIHHWINNAAVCEGPIKFDEIQFDDIYNILTTNLLGTVHGFKVARDLGAENIYAVSGHGSDGGKTGDFALYGASKAAVSQFVKSLVEEFGDTNVRIIAPGIMKTELSRKLLESEIMTGWRGYLFGLMCADPVKVAEKVVPRILSAKGTGNVIRV